MSATYLRTLGPFFAIALLTSCVTLQAGNDDKAGQTGQTDDSSHSGESSQSVQTERTSNSREGTISQGLREALMVGTQRAVERTNKLDGYLANELIRIGLPPELQSASKRLRDLGLGSQVDRLEVAMNRAAEQAAGEATTIFTSAVRNMRPADVYAVFNGGDDGATRFLRSQSEQSLRASYEPVVHAQMADVNVYGYYQEIARTWNRLPLAQPLTVDLEEYVTEKALDGLFSILAEEEARIREDPVARSSELLRRVFGNL